MARHARDDEGSRTLELGKLVAGGAHGDGAWENDREPRRIWPAVLTVTASILATALGWSLAGALNPDPPPVSSAVPVVETVTQIVEPSPAPTVTRWRTRTPSPGKPAVVTLTPRPAPAVTVTRWRTRTSSPSPVPTVTVVRTKYLTPPGGDDEITEIPGHPGTHP